MFFLKGGHAYPVPPSLNLRRSCCCLAPPLLVVGGDAFWIMGNEVSGGLVCLGGVLACLPKEVDPRAPLPLGPLHAYPVRCHPGSLYAAVGGTHQRDRNPTLDVSTRLQVGMLPLGGQATGYPLQGSRSLHSQQPDQ